MSYPRPPVAPPPVYQQRKPFPRWAIVLIAVGLLLFAGLYVLGLFVHEEPPGTATVAITAIDWNVPPKVTPKQGYAWIAVQLTVISQARGVIVDPNYARLFDGLDTRYLPIIQSGKQPVLITSAELPKGQAVTGWLTFEVPAGQKNLRLRYQAGPVNFEQKIN